MKKYEIGDRVIAGKGNIEHICPVEGKIGTVLAYNSVTRNYCVDFGDGLNIWCDIKDYAPTVDTDDIKPTESTEVNEVKTPKKSVIDLDFFDSIKLAFEMAKIQCEYTQRLVDLAVELGVDEMAVIEMGNRTLVDTASDPEFKDKVLPEMIKTALEGDEDDE